jgi:hypothetical protein
MPPVLPVRVPEPSLELRLLDEWDVDKVEHRERGSPDRVRERQQDEGLPEKDKDHSRNHGVANKAVGAAEDERAGRIPGRQGAFPLGCEAPERGEEEEKAYGEESDPNELEGDCSTDAPRARASPYRRAIQSGTSTVTVNGRIAIARR